MQAYHNDPAIKAKYIARIRAHRAADDLIKGTGWNNGKGCAIGCTLESYDHARYPIELGLPEWLARLEDRIFEGLPTAQAMEFPERLLAAIPVGTDLDPVRHRLAIRRMDRLIAAQADEPIVAAIVAVRDCHAAELAGLPCDWSAAESAAESAESAAESAAWSAACKQEADDLISIILEGA